VHFWHEHNRNIFRALLGTDLPEEEFQRLSERKEAYFRDSVRRQHPCVARALEWLERFHAWASGRRLPPRRRSKN
jgi:hypothetical protein